MCMQQVCVWVCMCVCVCVCVHSCACAYVFVIINLVNFENSKNYSPLISMHGCQPIYMGHYRMIPYGNVFQGICSKTSGYQP